MLRYSMWAVVAALAVWVVVPNPTQAGGGGHGGGGGGHGGGGHAGGVHGGSFHGGSFHGGSFHNGNFHNGNFHNGFHSGVFIGVGYGGYGYGYGPGLYAYPSYGYGGYYSDSYSYPTTVYNNNTYVVPPNQSQYYSPEQAPMPMRKASDNKARIRVRVPADAALWIDGEPTRQTGEAREFITPALEPETTYTYTMKARWMQGNEPVERTIKVDVQANQTSIADFLR
jgi:uncharacterized protein (TIGR03000 family)